MKSKVKFIDEELEKAFYRMDDKDPIKKALIRAIENIKEDFRSGEYIPKDKIPESYLEKFGINNLRVYDLPSAWRLLYSVINDDIEIISIILDWISHKDYERLFRF